jgi:hypothetical protein
MPTPGLADAMALHTRRYHDGDPQRVHSGGRMTQIVRELKRQAAGEKLAPEQIKGLIRAGYV